MKEENKETPIADNTVEKLKVKKPKTKKFKRNEDEVVKVDLNKKEEEKTDDVVKVDLDKPVEEIKVEKTEETTETVEQPVEEKIETPVLEEITEDSTEEQVAKAEEEVIEAIEKSEETGKPLPESVEKLVNFMEETGGDLNDYVKLNQDYSKLENNDLLYEYYKQTKPHLNTEEINFLMEDQFSYDEDEDEEIDIKRKKLALKEQVADARAHLDGQKSKYYEEIKAGSKLTNEQQKAVNFFNRYNKESEETKKIAKVNSDIFTQKTNQVFNNEFKGFEYNVGDKKYRFNVNNAEEIKTTQSDLNNFTKKFLDKKMALKDAVGYHKSLYTAMNSDAVAKHFYEQGKADAIKDSIAKGKNVNMDPRQNHGVVEAGGVKVKVLGDDSSGFKFKIKNNK